MTFMQAPRRGFALIAVLIVVMLASMVAISLLFRIRADETAAAAGEASEQAWAAAMSGVQEVLQLSPGGDADPATWLDNPELFQKRLVFSDGADEWFFSIYTAGESVDSVRFGLSDEAAKLNLNEVDEEMIAKLPGLKLTQAQALWDFIDANNEPRPEGAEQEYYDTLAAPYSVRNARLDTLDELLLVRGFTPAVLNGEDANFNCRLDPNEDDGAEQAPPDNNDGALSRGLRDLVTVSSYDLNIDSDGAPRTDINDPEDPIYTNGLPDAVVHYIEAMRSNHIVITHPAELLEATAKVKDAAGKEVQIESGVGKEELAAVLDLFTAELEDELPGLVNINTASATVLQTLPGIDASMAESIVSTRRGLARAKLRTPAWLFQEGIVDAAAFKKLAPYVTTRSWQYSFYVMGYGLPSGRYRVLEVSVDFAGEEPAVTYLRDITRLGLPFSILGDPDAAPSRNTVTGDRVVRGMTPKFEKHG